MLLPVPPRVGVCAIIFPRHACGTVDVSHVLLIQRARAPAARLWAFPGGHVLSGERLAAAAAREVGEETGLAVSVPANAQPVAAQEALDHDPAGALLSHYLLAHVVGTWPWGAEPPPLAGDARARRRPRPRCRRRHERRARRRRCRRCWPETCWCRNCLRCSRRRWRRSLRARCGRRPPRAVSCDSCVSKVFRKICKGYCACSCVGVKGVQTLASLARASDTHMW